MGLRTCGDHIHLQTTLVSPRGRTRSMELPIASSVDQNGIHATASFRGPMGGVWTTHTNITFDELLAVLKEKVKHLDKDRAIAILRELLPDALKQLF